MTNIKQSKMHGRKLYKMNKLSHGTISKQLCKNSQILCYVKRTIMYNFLTSVLHTRYISVTQHCAKDE